MQGRTEQRLTALQQAAARAPGLELLVLFGSRARGECRRGSDWDLGFLSGPGFDPDALLADAALILQSDRVDLVDLGRASGLLRFRAATDGRALFEAHPGSFDAFCIDAARFWLDVAPVLDRAYAELLAGIAP